MGNHLHQQGLSDGSYGTEESIMMIQKIILNIIYIEGLDKKL